MEQNREKIVDISAPAMVLEYTASLGGTDVIDHAFSWNKIKKMVFSLAYILPPIISYNSYLIYHKTPNGATAYLDSLRPVVQTYLISHGKSAKIPWGQMLYGNKSVDKRVSKAIRNDQIGHFVDNAQERARCAFCHQPSAVYQCVKCNVHVHLKCFAAFHNSE